LLAIHDGVRPFVSEKMITDCLKAAREHGAAVVGVPLKDTIKKASHAGFVLETPARADFWLVQTPQAFRREVISAAYARALRDGFYATDDAALVERNGGRVKMVEGAYGNIKLTTAEDIIFARALMGERAMTLVGFGYDSHRLVEGRSLMLGGIQVPFAKGLLGHSDADVLLHAIIDAIIGALGSGDIGGFFPDTDARYQDADSALLLGEVLKRVREKGLVVGNIDATVVLEEPRLRPLVEAMREKIANIASVLPERVNIKAKTNEKMGFVGAGEGIAAFAVVTLKEG
jgi:2-C-methyl-D-erythritol 4-phosphate cytidylyltransferase/2-C-methyl-D-erythritol 2,4-cyclodiphosphate synthase